MQTEEEFKPSLWFYQHWREFKVKENGKRKRKLLLKNEDISKGKTHTHTQTHGNLRYFDNHRCLSQSEETKCM